MCWHEAACFLFRRSFAHFSPAIEHQDVKHRAGRELCTSHFASRHSISAIGYGTIFSVQNLSLAEEWLDQQQWSPPPGALQSVVVYVDCLNPPKCLTILLQASVGHVIAAARHSGGLENTHSHRLQYQQSNQSAGECGEREEQKGRRCNVIVVVVYHFYVLGRTKSSKRIKDMHNRMRRWQQVWDKGGREWKADSSESWIDRRCLAAHQTGKCCWWQR